MARGQKNRTSRQDQRDATPRRYSSAVLGLQPWSLPSVRRYEYPSLGDIEDRRRYGFSVQTPPRTLTVGPVRQVVKRAPLNRDRFANLRPSPVTLSSRVQFEHPRRVVLCIRRKVRKQVIHALKLTKKGAGSARRHNEWSHVAC